MALGWTEGDEDNHEKYFNFRECGDDQLQCDDCGNLFKTERGLRKHIETKHSNQFDRRAEYGVSQIHDADHVDSANCDQKIPHHRLQLHQQSSEGTNSSNNIRVPPLRKRRKTSSGAFKSGDQDNLPLNLNHHGNGNGERKEREYTFQCPHCDKKYVSMRMITESLFGCFDYLIFQVQGRGILQETS